MFPQFRYKVSIFYSSTLEMRLNILNKLLGVIQLAIVELGFKSRCVCTSKPYLNMSENYNINENHNCHSFFQSYNASIEKGVKSDG